VEDDDEDLDIDEDPGSTPTPHVILCNTASAHTRLSSLGKRKSPPATQPSADNMHIIKTMKPEPSGTRNRLIARDLPLIFQAILTDAQGHFCSMTSTCAGFPNAVKAQEFAMDAWHKSCKHKGVVIEFEEEFCRLVCVWYFNSGYTLMYFCMQITQ
jgi:hypothetical protein